MTNIVYFLKPCYETRPLCGVAPKAQKYPSAIVIAEGYPFLSYTLCSIERRALYIFLSEQPYFIYASPLLQGLRIAV